MARIAITVLFLLTSLGFAQEAPKKIAKGAVLTAAISRVQPDYPIAARQLKIEGDVELEAVIGENGSVEKVTIVSGNPVLTRAAVEALKRWKFTPFVEGGKPIRVTAPVSFAFKL
ncbi:MAG TPA: energy transducer TonB [Bryobacteraceae bacterium]|nr:energy transducer TonB [Bryobacteraceae bacterium]